MSTCALIRIFVTVFLMVATLPLAAWDYNQCVGSKITWGSDTWVDFKLANGAFPEGPLRNSISAALGAWNFAPGHPFTFVPHYVDLTGATLGNFSNEIIFTTSGFGPNELAVTKTWHSCTNLQEADVLFNSNKSWSLETNPTTLPVGSPYSLTGVAIHQLGHAMGLKDVTSTLAMMAPYYPLGGIVGQGTQQHFQPLADDVQGARAGYPGWCCPVVYDLYSSAYGSYNETDTGLIIPASQVYRGGIGHFGFSIGNRGTSFANAQVNFYFSADRIINTSDTYMGSTTVSLSPGAHPKAFVNFNIPTSFPAGTYYFGYIVDPGNAIAEDDEANNAVAMAYPTQVPTWIPPTACFTRTPTTGTQNTTFTFNASCSSDPDGYIANYTWDFGDGDVDTESGAIVSRRFEPGSYMVTLTVTDNEGHSGETMQSVLVTGSSGCLVCE